MAAVEIRPRLVFVTVWGECPRCGDRFRRERHHDAGVYPTATHMATALLCDGCVRVEPRRFEDER